MFIYIIFNFYINSNTSEKENDSSNNNGAVISYKNKPLVIDTFAEPLERTYDENDLLTKIYHINPNWKPGDPEDYRYITSYINEGYTGFLPIQLKINPPNFVQQWGIEQSNGFIEWKSLPILENGKYKYYYNNGQAGPFGLGFVPVKRYNQNTEDYDFIVNIPGEVIQPNIATLKITDGVLDSILTMEGGTLNLPSNLPALNEATAFNTNGKDYATGVSIDLSELTYYPTMPMPQFNNGEGSNIIEITENNSRLTFEEFDGNRKTIEYITTPENPTPTPLMRSIVLQKGKGKTRDATTSNIVGYVDVNIPPPNVSQTIRNNGYYNFNSDWTALVEGTEQNHKLDIQVPTNTTTKTITIDTIGNNQSTTYNASNDNADGYSSVTIVNNTSTNLQNKTVDYTGYFVKGTYSADNGFNGLSSITFNNINTMNTCVTLSTFETTPTEADVFDFKWDNYTYKTININGYYFSYFNSSDTSIYKIFSSSVSNGFKITRGTPYFYVCHKPNINDDPIPFILNHVYYKASNDKQGLYDVGGSNDLINWITLYQNPNPNNPPEPYNPASYQIDNLISYKYYRIKIKTINEIYLERMIYNLSIKYCTNESLNMNNLLLENNKELTLSSNDAGSTVYLNPSNGYNGFTNAIITVPHTLTKNYTAYDANNPLVISSTTGTITIPEGFTGLGEIHFTVIEPKKRAVKYGLDYSSYKGLISDLPNAGGNYTIHRYYGEGNTTQVFINPTENQVISLASSGDSWSLYVPATFKHVELGTGDNPTTNYYFRLYDENDNVLYTLKNQTGSSGYYSSYINTVPSDIEIIA